MRIVKWLLVVLLLLGGVFVAGGLLLPDTVEVRRSTTIERPPAQVFALINGFGRFNEWSPWADYDASASYTFEGPASGVGATMRWRGDKGEGSQRIIALDPDRRLDVALDFGGSGRGTASFLLAPSAAGTDLIWTFGSDFEGNYFGRWMGLFMDRLVGGDYQRGLAALKRLAESEPLPAPAPTEESDEEVAEDESSPGDDPG